MPFPRIIDSWLCSLVAKDEDGAPFASQWSMPRDYLTPDFTAAAASIQTDWQNHPGTGWPNPATLELCEVRVVAVYS